MKQLREEYAIHYNYLLFIVVIPPIFITCLTLKMIFSDCEEVSVSVLSNDGITTVL